MKTLSNALQKIHIVGFIKLLFLVIVRLVFSFILATYLILLLIFPTASFDDYYMHLKLAAHNEISQSNISDTISKENNADHHLSSDIKTPLDSNENANANTSMLLNTLTKSFSFDLTKMIYIKDQKPVKQLKIIKIIFGIFYFIVTICILHLTYYLNKKNKFTYKCFWILLFSGICFLIFKCLELYYREDALKNYYYNPKKILHSIQDIAPKNTYNKRKNILIIYVESLETSFSNADKFGKDLLAPLKDLGGISMAMTSNVGTTNSLTGTYASLCGLPLYQGSSGGGGQSISLDRKFCFGDILDHIDYKQKTIQGTDENNLFTREFKNIFTKQKIKFEGCQDLVKKGYQKSQDSFDGCMHNQEILAQTTKQLKIYAQNSIPRFNLSTFLIDTHGPQGLFAKNCLEEERNDVNQIRGSVTCAVRNLSTKIKQWQKKGYLDNTVTVIMGDHLFMPGMNNRTYFQNDNSSDTPTQRKVYFQIIGHDMTKFILQRSDMNHFDVLPTMLDVMGLLPDKQTYLGLGSSIFKPDPHFKIRQSKFKDNYYFFSEL